MKRNYKIMLVPAGVGLAAIVAVLFFRITPELKMFPVVPARGVNYESYTVRGDSLAPQFTDGQQVKLFTDYYDCHSLSAGDAVAYHWAGNPDAPIAKIVKAVAGDRWRMELVPEKNAYQIEVNGQWLANSEGALYQIPEEKAKMLLLYAESYPEIPEETCLILGNIPQGSDDSVKFGLASQKNIAGRINP
jgi:signal peptidase I